MRRSLLLSLLAVPLGLLIWLPVLAQDDFAEEGLTTEDVTTDLAAESLPTTNGLSYWWEGVRSRVAEAFTFNAERKAARQRARLHRLDRKAEACAELGDEECLATIEEHRATLQERAEAFIARRVELSDELEARFNAWREAREGRRAELRERVAERRDQRQERREERRTDRQEARTNRRETLRERRETRRDTIQDQRDTRRDARQERREDVRLRREERRTIRNEARIRNDVNIEVDTAQ